MTDCGLFGVFDSEPFGLSEYEFTFGPNDHFPIEHNESTVTDTTPGVHNIPKDSQEDTGNPVLSSTLGSVSPTSPPVHDLHATDQTLTELSASSINREASFRDETSASSDHHCDSCCQDHGPTEELYSSEKGARAEESRCVHPRTLSKKLPTCQVISTSQAMSQGQKTDEIWNGDDKQLHTFEGDSLPVLTSKDTQKNIPVHPPVSVPLFDTKFPTFDEEALVDPTHYHHRIRRFTARLDHIVARTLRNRWIMYFISFIVGFLASLAWKWVVHGWRPGFWVRTAAEQQRWCRSTGLQSLLL